MKPCFFTNLLLSVCLVLSTSAMAFCDVNDLPLEHQVKHADFESSAPADSHDDKHSHHCHGHIVGGVFSACFTTVSLLPDTHRAALKSVVFPLSYPPLNPPPNT